MRQDKIPVSSPQDNKILGFLWEFEKASPRVDEKALKPSTQFGSYQTHKNRHLNLLAPAISQDIAISQIFFQRKPYFGCLGSCYSALVLMHTEVCICLGRFSEYHQNSCTQLFIYKRPSHFRQKYSSVIAQPYLKNSQECKFHKCMRSLTLIGTHAKTFESKGVSE